MLFVPYSVSFQGKMRQLGLSCPLFEDTKHIGFRCLLWYLFVLIFAKGSPHQNDGHGYIWESAQILLASRHCVEINTMNVYK